MRDWQSEFLTLLTSLTSMQLLELKSEIQRELQRRGDLAVKLSSKGAGG